MRWLVIALCIPVVVVFITCWGGILTLSDHIKGRLWLRRLVRARRKELR